MPADTHQANIFDRHLSGRQRLAVELLTGALTKGRLANAYLLTGRIIDDKWQLAKQMAAFLNCERTRSYWQNAQSENQPVQNLLGLPISDEVFQQANESLKTFRMPEDRSCLSKSISGDPVNMCRDCRWIQEDAHPECLYKLAPGEKTSSRKISVESARNMSETLARTSSAFRIVIVEDASQDVFHRPSANALLKTLEEPPEHTIFFLFAENAEAVLPTVVSRSQVVPVPQIPFSDGEPPELPPISFHKTLRDGASKKSKAYLSALDFSQIVLKAADSLVDDDDNVRVAISKVVDYVLKEEYERLKVRALHSLNESKYLADLLELGEEAKSRVDHYVNPKAALESFSIAWARLAQNAQVLD